MAELALLSLAEGFRTSNPPDIPATIQCLLAVLNLRPATLRVAQTNLQIAKLLLQNTNQADSQVIKSFLEKAVSIFPKETQRATDSIVIFVISYKILYPMIPSSLASGGKRLRFWHPHLTPP